MTDPRPPATEGTQEPAPGTTPQHDVVAAQRANRLRLAQQDREQHEAEQASRRLTSRGGSTEPRTLQYRAETGVTAPNARHDAPVHGPQLHARTASGRAIGDLAQLTPDAIVTLNGTELPVSVAQRLGWLEKTGDTYRVTPAGGGSNTPDPRDARADAPADGADADAGASSGREDATSSGFHAALDSLGVDGARVAATFIADHDDAIGLATDLFGDKGEGIVRSTFAKAASEVGSALERAGLADEAEAVAAMSAGRHANDWRAAADAYLTRGDASGFTSLARTARARGLAADDALAQIEPGQIDGEHDSGAVVYTRSGTTFVSLPTGERMRLRDAVAAGLVHLDRGSR